MSEIIHVRVDEQLKNDAANTLKSMNLKTSVAVRLFLTYVVREKKLPFEVKASGEEK